jgi:hypothetical protein
MKKLLTLTLLSVLILPLGGFAADKKKATPAPADAKKPDATPAPDAAKHKPLPMYSRVDSIDAPGKTFTNKRRDGVEVKHVLTATTEIKNGDAPAKFEDIKVGDYVSGSRLKKSETEYEVIKITKFGPKPVKAPKTGAKPAEAKPADPKPQ